MKEFEYRATLSCLVKVVATDVEDAAAQMERSLAQVVENIPRSVTEGVVSVSKVGQAYLMAVNEDEPQPEKTTIQESASGTGTSYEELRNSRQKAADEVFSNYDFGNELIAANGWEITSPGDTWVRTIFMRDPNDPEGESVKNHFNVEFHPGRSAVKDHWLG